jgi:hypothetical protein
MVQMQRMGKRQPMCWSLEGAHFLLQVRCAVLDGRLETLFREWQRRRDPSHLTLIAEIDRGELRPHADRRT